MAHAFDTAQPALNGTAQWCEILILHLNVKACRTPGRDHSSTRGHLITTEATPLDRERTFVHFRYAHAYGVLARLAMEAYLHTAAKDKVGFSVTGRDEAGRPTFVGGVLGVVERNSMRYYLAIVAYLGALGLPPGEQFEKRSRDWFTLTERYPLQLHEVEQKAYLDMKRREYRGN